MVWLYDIDLYKGAMFPEGEDPRSVEVQRLVAKNVLKWQKSGNLPAYNTFKYRWRICSTTAHVSDSETSFTTWGTDTCVNSAE